MGDAEGFLLRGLEQRLVLDEVEPCTNAVLLDPLPTLYTDKVLQGKQSAYVSFFGLLLLSRLVGMSRFCMQRITPLSRSEENRSAERSIGR